VSARLFAALELPAPVRDALGAFGRAAAADDFALRAVRDDALHVTLAFLGHRALDDIDPAREAVREVAVPVPDLALGDALWLAPRRPHVLTVPSEGALVRRRKGRQRRDGDRQRHDDDERKDERHARLVAEPRRCPPQDKTRPRHSRSFAHQPFAASRPSSLCRAIGRCAPSLG